MLLLTFFQSRQSAMSLDGFVRCSNNRPPWQKENEMRNGKIPVILLREANSGEGPEVYRLDEENEGNRFFTNLLNNTEIGHHGLEVKEITEVEWQEIVDRSDGV